MKDKELENSDSESTESHGKTPLDIEILNEYHAGKVRCKDDHE